MPLERKHSCGVIFNFLYLKKEIVIYERFQGLYLKIKLKEWQMPFEVKYLTMVIIWAACISKRLLFIKLRFTHVIDSVFPIQIIKETTIIIIKHKHKQQQKIMRKHPPSSSYQNKIRYQCGLHIKRTSFFKIQIFYIFFLFIFIKSYKQLGCVI